MYDLGSRLKEVRIARGLSQRALGKRINKCAGTISSYENNIQIPPTEVLANIANVLSVPLDYFLDVNCKTAYSDSALTPNQQEIIELLFREFIFPTNEGRKLSDQQLEILRKLVLLFTDE